MGAMAQIRCNRSLAGKQAVHLLSEGLSNQFDASFQQHLELVRSSQPTAALPAAHSAREDGLDVLTHRIAALQAAEARRATEEMLYLR